jgi:hypothetical protein
MIAEKITRREIIKRAAYVAPVILTLTAVPAFAKGGSGRHGNNESDENDERENGEGWDKKKK